MTVNRRHFLKGSLTLAGLLAVGCPVSQLPTGPDLKGGRVDPDFQQGHRLRDGEVPEEIASTRRVGGVILGGGISGLSAAWRWSHAGYEDFVLLELESTVGGNSRALDYPASPAPIGAHYLPVPNTEARAVRRLLQEMGVLTQDGQGRWKLDERHLCHSPHERVFAGGRWHDGLIPEDLLEETAEEQLEAFQQHVQEWQQRRDGKGRKVFALPLTYSSREESYLALDRISLATYAQQQGWDEPALLWYLDYACRDDFGGTAHTCSAWAGLHYFASRDGGGLADDGAVLVWPEGNRRLVTHLSQGLEARIQGACLVVGVTQQPDRVEVDYLDTTTGLRHRVSADIAVCCLPTFVRSKLFRESYPSFEYSPWLTANLSLSRMPTDLQGPGFIAWDNVIRESSSLGYVVATHQNLTFDSERPTVWTWYRPFTEKAPAQIRTELLEARWETWSETVLSELEQVHPDIRELCTQLDITLLGHGMIRPSPGLIWGEEMVRARQPRGRVFFGHGDLSGMSLFEESQYRGVLAAEQALISLGRELETFL